MSLKAFFGLILILCSSLSFSQDRLDDVQGWSWVQVEGEFEEKNATDTDPSHLAYSMEFHYRVKNEFHDYSQVILRPMIGYKSGDATIWLGVAYFNKDQKGVNVNEYRMFQMVSYQKKIPETPILLIANGRLEERIVENRDEMNLRLRVGLKLSIELFKLKSGTVKIYFQDQVFFNLNDTKWAGNSGYTQNRISVGLDYNTKIGRTPVTFSTYYMESSNLNRTIGVVGVGAKIKIPTKKRTR